MTDNNDQATTRLADIRADLDDGIDADDAVWLLSLAEQLQGQRDRAAARHGYETDMDGYRRCLTCRRPGGGATFWPCDDATALGLDTEETR